ncbi:MAG: HAD-IC family P-type ATPase, partial [Sphingomonas sp.]|nr:HAD-IC family P-type ATPase [Sphingomonas sp.]
PLARAVAAALEGVAPAPLDDLVEHPGLGIEGWCAGARARLGRPDWVLGDDLGGDAARAAFAWGDCRARLAIADPLRPDAAAAIAALDALGLAPVMFSGDSRAGVASVAGVLGITAAARMSPADKAARIAALEAGGARVLMVGDGLNDGPALKAASVAMAPAQASDVGQQAADALFLGDRLSAVPRAVRAARATMAVVRQNFALAIGYNALAVPLAIAGQVTPLVAALAMSGSSLLVVANALRLRGAAR